MKIGKSDLYYEFCGFLENPDEEVLEKMQLKSDAPENTKKAFNEWLREEIEARKEGLTD